MSFLKVEKLVPITNKYPVIEVGVDKIEEEGEKNEEWLSADGKIEVVLMVMGGGVGWEETWLKDIRLNSTNSVVGGELMRVQYVKNTDTNSCAVSLHVEGLDLKEGEWVLENYFYSSDAEGTKELEDSRTSEDVLGLIEGLALGTLRMSTDLPERIDVGETARLFVEQLQERNFSLPELISL